MLIEYRNKNHSLPEPQLSSQPNEKRHPTHQINFNEISTLIQAALLIGSG
jgi:hypothetical protein